MVLLCCTGQCKCSPGNINLLYSFLSDIGTYTHIFFFIGKFDDKCTYLKLSDVEGNIVNI